MGLGVREELGIRPEGCDVLTFLLAHFHHIIEQLRFRQSSVGSIFLSAGEPGELSQHSRGLGCYSIKDWKYRAINIAWGPLILRGRVQRTAIDGG